jgi:hypothetical protein
MTSLVQPANHGDVWTVESLYLRNPTMEYGQAFDLAVLGWDLAAGPALAVASSPVHAVEWLKRWPGALHLAGSGDFDAAGFVSQARGWAWGPLEAVTLEPTGRRYNDIAWAEPETHTAATLAAALHRLARPGACLSVIASSRLRRHLPAWQTAPLPATHPLSPGALGQVLRATDWQPHHGTAFHGPRSIVWTRLAQLAERLGRPDWGDRCLFAMRASYQEPGWLWPLAPLALTRARAA